MYTHNTGRGDISTFNCASIGLSWIHIPTYHGSMPIDHITQIRRYQYNTMINRALLIICYPFIYGMKVVDSPVQKKDTDSLYSYQ